jgi:hypothetical protein
VEALLTDPLGPLWCRVLTLWHAETRPVELDLGAGRITFRDKLVFRTIRARDVVAASTARTPGGVALTLVTRWRGRRPLTFEVANEEEAAAVRRALGIGHHGFGEIGLPADVLLASTAERFVRAVSGVGTLAALAVLFSPPWPPDWANRIISAFPLFTYAVVPFIVVMMFAIRRRTLGAGLVLAGGFVRIREQRGWRQVAYADIRAVYADDRGIRLAMNEGPDVAIPARSGRWSRDRPSRNEIDVAAAQIVSALQRARGQGELAPTVPLRVCDLAKTESDAHAWLARLDATAASIGSDAGYRGAAFDESDLWETVDSADAPPELRAAAARVLLRAIGDRARTKLDEILPRVRVDDDARKIRIALDEDTERASAAWESVERRESRRNRAV